MLLPPLYPIIDFSCFAAQRRSNHRHDPARRGTDSRRPQPGREDNVAKTFFWAMRWLRGSPGQLRTLTFPWNDCRSRFT